MEKIYKNNYKHNKNKQQQQSNCPDKFYTMYCHALQMNTYYMLVMK